MAEDTKIQLADSTFTPWERSNDSRVVAAESMWREPLKWNRQAEQDQFIWSNLDEIARRGWDEPERPRVFCASLADVFEDWQGAMMDSHGSELWGNNDGFWSSLKGHDTSRQLFKLTLGHVRNRLFHLIDNTPNLDWLVLTKRPENIAGMMPPFSVDIHFGRCRQRPGLDHSRPNPFPHTTRITEHDTIRHNVWLGTSVENQQSADERIPHLLKVPAAVRFLSVEPLLGPVDLTPWLYPPLTRQQQSAFASGGSSMISARPLIDLVIIGGESGPGARPCNIEWIRDIVRQCKAAGVACFVKQLGAEPMADSVHGGRLTLVPLKDPKGGDIDEFPSDLRIREMPCSK